MYQKEYTYDRQQNRSDWGRGDDVRLGSGFGEDTLEVTYPSNSGSPPVFLSSSLPERR